MSEVRFFIFAALLISSAVSVVTITDLRKAALAFFLLNVVLASFFLIEGPALLALVQFFVGAAVSAFFLRRNSESERASGISMVKSPNGAIGLFILICFTMIVTPVWMYSVWKPQPGDAPVALSEALSELAGGQYLLVIAAALMMFTVVVVSFWRKPTRARNISPGQSVRGTAGTHDDR